MEVEPLFDRAPEVEPLFDREPGVTQLDRSGRRSLRGALR
jgi:hypothetical protein